MCLSPPTSTRQENHTLVSLNMSLNYIFVNNLQCLFPIPRNQCLCRKAACSQKRVWRVTGTFWIAAWILQRSQRSGNPPWQSLIILDFLFQNGKLMKKREILQMYLKSVVICAFYPLGILPAIFMPQLLKNYGFNQFLRETFRATASLWGTLKVFSAEFKSHQCSLSSKYIP